MEEQQNPQTFAKLGGEPGITRWMTRFYEEIATHPLLRGLFTQELAVSRDRQIAFMVEFFGGPPLYTERHGKAFLRFKHRHVRIGQPERDAWLELIMACLREAVADAELLAEVEGRLAPLATAMINHHPEKKDAYFFN